MSISKLRKICRGLLLLIIFLIPLFSIGACKPIGDAVETAMAITRTFTATLDPTCAPFSISTPAPLVHSPKLLIVLYQTQGWNDLYTNRALQIIYDIIPDVIVPGDYVQIFAIGEREYEDAEVIAGTVGAHIEAPGLPPTPIMPSGWTPEPTSTLSGITLPDLQEENFYATRQAISAATATSQYQEYVCLQAIYTQTYGNIAASWGATQTAMVSNYENDLREAVRVYNAGQDTRPQPEQSMLFFALSQATVTLDAKCSEFGRCILIILSDLRDWRTQQVVEGLTIDLNGAEILAPILDCPNIIRPECSGRANEWREYFSAHGARSSDFTDNNDVENWLYVHIRR